MDGKKGLLLILERFESLGKRLGGHWRVAGRLRYPRPDEELKKIEGQFSPQSHEANAFDIHPRWEEEKVLNKFISVLGPQRQPKGRDMSEQRTDFRLLREFVRRDDQEAFAMVVRRHIDLVYATALRKMEDQGAAEEVAQNDFSALARKAWRFAPDDSLPGWLYRTTLLETKDRLRRELRRRRREQTAAELGTTMRLPEEHSALREREIR